jgi:ABC-type transporter Mla MlaB component
MIFADGPGLYANPAATRREVHILSGSELMREPSTIRLVIEGPMTPADVAALCEHVRALVHGRQADLVICDLGALTDADLGTIDALARVQLTSRRLGCQVRVRNAPPGLGDLLLFAGLGQVLRLWVEASGQAEKREVPLGVQEECDSADPIT